MRVIIDIPDTDIPKRQDMLEIDLCFIDGHISQCTYPFEVLQNKTIDLNDQMVKAETKPKIGHWISIECWYDVGRRVKCSECGQVFCLGEEVSKNYCANCGAKMVEPQESEDKDEKI